MEPAPPEEGFGALRAGLARATGLDLVRFKERYLMRRVDARRRALGLDGWAAYLEAVERDPLEVERLRERLTVHVTEFFRDRDVWGALEADGLPVLAAAAARRRPRELRLWSAGCSTGEEAYSLALSALEAVGRVDAGIRVRVLGGDLDRGVLARAAEGVYPSQALGAVPQGAFKRHFVPAGPLWSVGPELRRAVVFRSMDLFASPPPPEMDLILCRNVMIYFSRDTQQRLLHAFRQSLRAGGLLVTGKTETVLGEARVGYECLSASQRIFRRR